MHRDGFPAWPVWDRNDEKAWLEVLRSGKWFRGYGDRVEEFEAAYAALTGARRCVATANGTSALWASLGGLGVGPGDEVILPPYTFVATLNVVLLQYALPVFVDSDIETFQIDAGRIEDAVTDRTAAIMPVHLGGNAADLDTILAVARKRNVPVIEDACQSHLVEWRGRKVGTWGATGCFSFQASKNLNSGEGGAILTDDEALAERCYAFHNNSRPSRSTGYDPAIVGSRAANLRMTEFQGTLLMTQMARLEAQSRKREENASDLTRRLNEIPGIEPAKMHAGCTRNAYHLYMFRYLADEFAGLPRAAFLRALSAEGIPCSGGYSPLNKLETLKTTLRSRAYQKIYPARALAEWEERTRCPVNDRLCDQAVWFTQRMLLGSSEDMERIVAAIERIRKHADELRRKA